MNSATCPKSDRYLQGVALTLARGSDWLPDKSGHVLVLTGPGINSLRLEAVMPYLTRSKKSSDLNELVEAVLNANPEKVVLKSAAPPRSAASRRANKVEKVKKEGPMVMLHHPRTVLIPNPNPQMFVSPPQAPTLVQRQQPPVQHVQYAHTYYQHHHPMPYPAPYANYPYPQPYYHPPLTAYTYPRPAPQMQHPYHYPQMQRGYMNVPQETTSDAVQYRLPEPRTRTPPPPETSNLMLPPMQPHNRNYSA